MQLTGRRGAQSPLHVSLRAAAVEALICEWRAMTARS
jgi:hypothetical protein